jgi:hypothetical protein
MTKNKIWRGQTILNHHVWRGSFLSAERRGGGERGGVYNYYVFPTKYIVIGREKGKVEN